MILINKDFKKYGKIVSFLWVLYTENDCYCINF